MMISNKDYADIEAALNQFPESEKALKVLFPCFFTDRKKVLLKEDKKGIADEGGNLALFIRNYGTYANRAIYLSPTYQWELIKDEQGALILVPTKK